MKRDFLILAGLAGGLVAAVGAARGAQDEWKLPAGEPKLKVATGSDLASAHCVLCHSVDYIITQPTLTRDQWKANVTKMQQKFGATVPAEKVDPLVDYLVRNYGK